MKTATPELEQQLNEKIDATLERIRRQEDTSGDLFDVIRWARNGWLVRG